MSQRNAGRCKDAEPALTDMLDDPVLHAILRRDRVSRDDLLAVIAGARRRLGIADDCAAPAPRPA